MIPVFKITKLKKFSCHINKKCYTLIKKRIMIIKTYYPLIKV